MSKGYINLGEYKFRVNLKRTQFLQRRIDELIVKAALLGYNIKFIKFKEDYDDVIFGFLRSPNKSFEIDFFLTKNDNTLYLIRAIYYKNNSYHFISTRNQFTTCLKRIMDLL